MREKVNEYFKKRYPGYHLVGTIAFNKAEILNNLDDFTNLAKQKILQSVMNIVECIKTKKYDWVDTFELESISTDDEWIMFRFCVDTTKTREEIKDWLFENVLPLVRPLVNGFLEKYK